MYTTEYITHSGFDILKNSLQGTALLFGDSSLDTLYTAILMLGVVLVAVAISIKVVFDSKTHPLEWVKPAGLAVMLYLLLVVPKGTINLYDDVENKSISIGGLPVGLVLMAGLTNNIETEINDRITLAMSPIISISDIGYGRTFDLYKNLFNSVDKTDSISPYHRMTVKNYMNDCVLWGVSLGDISVEDVQGNDNWTAIMNAASTYSSTYTTYHDATSAANMAGVTKTCTEAWASIQAQLWPDAAAHWERALKDYCSSTGFNSADPASYLECKNKMESFTKYITKTAVDIPATALLKQAWVSNVIAHTLSEGQSVDAAQMQGLLQTNTTLVSSGLMATEYIYIIKAVTTGIVFGSTIIMALLICTPFAKTAAQYWLGMYLWLLMWGVMDALLQTTAINYAYQFMQSNRESLGLGLAGMSVLGDNATKAIALMGHMRWMGMMLSASLTFGVFKFGGDAFTSFAGSLGSVPQGAGGGAGKVMTPEGATSAINEHAKSVAPTMAVTSRYGVEGMSSANTYEAMRQHSANSALGSSDTASEAGRIQGLNTVGNTVGAAGYSTHQEGNKQIYGKVNADGSTTTGEIDRLTGAGTETTTGMKDGLSFTKTEAVQSSKFGANASAEDILDSKQSKGGTYHATGTQSMDLDGKGSKPYQVSQDGMVGADGSTTPTTTNVASTDGSNFRASLDSKGNIVSSSDDQRNTISVAGGSIVMDKDGHVRDANLKGISTQFSNKIGTAFTKSDANSIAKSVGWQQILSNDTNASWNKGVDKRHTDSLSSTTRQMMSEGITTNNSLSNARSKETGQTLAGAISAGVGTPSISPIKVNGETRYQVETKTKDGTTQTFELSAQQKEAYDKITESAVTNAITKSASTSEGRANTLRIAENVNATQASQSLSQIRREEAAAAQITNNMDAAAFTAYADSNFGEIKNDRERYTAALNHIAETYSSGDIDKVSELNKQLSGPVHSMNDAATQGLEEKAVNAGVQPSEVTATEVEQHAQEVHNKANEGAEKLDKVPDKPGDPRQLPNTPRPDEGKFEEKEKEQKNKINGTDMPTTPFHTVVDAVKNAAIAGGTPDDPAAALKKQAGELFKFGGISNPSPDISLGENLKKELQEKSGDKR
ncbi:MAG: conjugal transfer protein TraG N-terminal domain-containing protein [Deltaproteobacteria bacterium]|nr:conjugal transfer protein TraG N-terminal domain-containing protein [Deltaproteobacteria bacterium]